MEVCRVMYCVLQECECVIDVPELSEESEQLGFPNYAGAIDGTHVPILHPQQDQEYNLHNLE